MEGSWQFRRELSPNELHLYHYLVQNDDFNVRQKEGRAKVNDLQAHGYNWNPLMEFEYFSANVESVHNTMC